MRFSVAAFAVAMLAPAWAAARSPVLEYPRHAAPDLRRARELDNAGARAYREGRYREALLLFTESYRLGGPSIELWNVARCHQRLDEGDDAAEVLAEFLAATDLLPGDRAEATRELNEIRRRPSPLIVDASASGSSVFVDGKRIGTAPLVIDVAPGKHVIRVELADTARETEVEARHGRPIVLRDGAEDPDGPETFPAPTLRRLEIDAQGGLYAHKLGDVSGRVGPSVTLGVRFGFGTGPLSGFFGLRGEFYSMGWSSQTKEQPLPGCALPDRYRATGLAGLVGGGVAWDPTRLVRASIELGGGLEGLMIEHAGGDVFVADCKPSPGVVPLFASRAEVSFRLARAARIALTPIAFAIHPAYEGAKSAPTDASGPWLRVGAALGLSYDVGL